MAVSGEASGADGQPLLSKDEVDRLQKFYGQVDDQLRKVKIRRLEVPLGCGGSGYTKSVWVWDWGRAESPTEPQFRSLERSTGCYDNDVLRRTLSASFAAAKKAKVPFADLINQQIIAAQALANSQNNGRPRR